MMTAVSIAVHVCVNVYFAAFWTWMIVTQVRHRRWHREGEDLSRAFDALMTHRERVLDPQVTQWDSLTVVEQERLRGEIERMLEEFREHQKRRTEWFDRCP